MTLHILIMANQTSYLANEGLELEETITHK